MPRRLPAYPALLVVVVACGGGTPGATGPDRPLPPYSGHAVELFDDAIEPVAVGYADAAANPAADTRLRERTQTGDAVVRARVMTVTSKAEDSGPSWQVGFHTVNRLGGAGPLDTDFTLSISSRDAAAGIVKAFESRLVGKTFIVFVREFAHEGAPPGERGDLRFHVAPDSTDEQQAVNAAILAQEVR